MTQSEFPALTPVCQQTQGLIDASLEGDLLTAEQQGHLQAHLTQCAYCRKYEVAMRNLLGSLKDLAELPPPPDLVAKIMTRVATVTLDGQSMNAAGQVVPFKTSPSKNALSRRSWLQARTLAPIAAAVMLLVVGGTLLTKLPTFNNGGPETMLGDMDSQYLAQGDQDEFGYDTNLAQNLPQGRQPAAPDPYDHALQQEGPRENTPLQNGQLMQDEGDVFANQIGLPTVMANSIMPQEGGRDPEDPIELMTGF